MNMNIFRRSNDKQYDGPSDTTAAMNIKQQQQQSPPIPRPRCIDATTSTSLNYHPRRTNSSNDKQRRHKSKNNAQLASGISSRRTSQQVQSHLSARVMTSTMETDQRSRRRSNKQPSTMETDDVNERRGRSNKLDVSSRSHQSSGGYNSTPSPKIREKRRVPMEHDGGILCLCSIPDTNDNYNLQAHRFLSGGTDGTIKLWEVNEPPPIENGINDAKMVPKLVRTYNGHSGYVQCIAVLGVTTMEVEPRRKSNFMSRAQDIYNEERRRSSYGVEDDDHSRCSGSKRSSKRIPSISSMNRRLSHLSHDSGSGASSVVGKQTRNVLLFVSASRDNTLRIWPIVDGNTNNNNNNEHQFDQDDASSSGLLGLDDSDKSEGGRSRELPFDESISTRGMKLRGHEFSKNNVGGVLCACAVPSVSSWEDEFDTNNCEGGRTSAGQFCSGGSDGRVRVWDVQSALNLKKIPKSGMYATVQLQCIDPDPAYSSSGRNDRIAAAITSLVCTGQNNKGGEVSLFAGDASGTIRRYSRVNECGDGHVNNAIWWGCTGIFGGHTHPITSMAMLSSASLMPLLCPNNIDEEEEEEDGNKEGTMLVSSCKDGWVRVWDAFDVRGRSNSSDGMLDSSERSHDDYAPSPNGRIPKQRAMWEIELNDGKDEAEVEHAARRGQPPTTINVSTLKDRIGVTSLTTLQAGTLMAAGTTDGTIRMWNVSSGMYEGAYNLGKSVQIWSLDMLSEQDATEEYYDEYGERKIRSVGIIVSGDNRGRIRVMRKVSSRSA